jgi:hypothetical protein
MAMAVVPPAIVTAAPVTFSRVSDGRVIEKGAYVPLSMRIVEPAGAYATACPTVRQGALNEPEALSEPLVAT